MDTEKVLHGPYHVAFIHVRGSRRGIIGRWDRSWGNVGPERDAELA